MVSAGYCMDLALAFLSGIASSAAGIVVYKTLRTTPREDLARAVASRYLELRRNCVTRDEAVLAVRTEIEAVLALTQHG